MNERIISFVNQFNYYNVSRTLVSSTKYVATFNDYDTIEVSDYNDSDFFAIVKIDGDAFKPFIEVSYDGKHVSASFNAYEEVYTGSECEYITNKLYNLTKCIL